MRKLVDQYQLETTVPEADDDCREEQAAQLWAELIDLVDAIWTLHDSKHLNTRMYCPNAVCVAARETHANWAG